MAQEYVLLDDLKDREYEVIDCLIDGLSNKEIADRLYLAASTVKWYVRQINTKLGTDNRRQIVEAVQQLGLMERADEPAQAAYQRPLHNLPRQTTPFVGRDAELDEIHSILEKEDVCLLTVLAQGGMGKTRIALESAEQQANRFPDGVYFVALQPLSDPTQIISQIASATGFQFGADNRSPEQQILDFLGNKSMLLLFDNFEHLLDGATLLNEILKAAPDVKLLVTSREKLNLSAETVYTLPGMQFPSWETPEDALHYDAVQLLVQAAQRVKADWQVTEDNLDFVARACHLTQGMPLGILLAASWLDVMDLAHICDEIQNSADILETDLRDVPKRQRSIRAVFDYSWQRLSDSERNVLMKMSVFRGGCTPDAAAEVTGANPRTLQRLMNKALLHRTKEGRYEMHELLRQYGEEMLQQSTMAADVMTAHMLYYCQMLKDQFPRLMNADQVDAVHTIERDYDNLMVAWESAMREDRLLISIIIPYTLFCTISGIYLQGLSLLEDTLSMFSSQPDHQVIIAKLKAGIGSILTWLSSNPEKADQFLDEAIVILKNETDSVEYLLVLNALGRAREEANKIDEALIIAHQLYDEANSANNLYAMRLAYVRLYFSSRWKDPGNLALLETYVDRGLELAQRMKVPDALGMAYTQKAIIYLQQDRLQDAQENIEYALSEFQKLNDKYYYILAYEIMVAILLFNGELQKAKDLSYHLLEMSEAIGSVSKKGQSHARIGSIYIMQMKTNDARVYMDKSRAIMRQGTSKLWQINYMPFYADIAQLEGDYDEALAMLQKDEKPEQYGFLYGQILCCLNRYDDGLPFIYQALESVIKAPVLPEVLKSLGFFALIIASRDDLIRATHLLALTFEHPVQLPCVIEHPKILELHHHLESKLTEDEYNAAWEHGKTLDLETVVREILADFTTVE